LNPTDVRALYLGGGALYQTGEEEAGKSWIRRALELDPNGIGTLYNVACFYSTTGHPDEAFECLERAIAVGFDTIDWVMNDPDLDRIRTDPRFGELLKKFKTQ
jgi:Flp pilus assembly protein TadD